MRVLMTGGGTGGHINPAIAIANEWKKRDPEAEFLFAATPGNMEECLGNGEHLDDNGNIIECCCDECDYLILCLKNAGKYDEE